ncbi:two-component regulator propeller domain-containing protein [Sediminibacterium sp.]|uniref:ligand-binding sensor domain-containing protein n=1 Tax=Sediminibacterium sp. TaxID=1917865 RepID=UPI002733CA95|nr:sensor histidine kinase [Sediminibacterium sp.]MDP3394606.1 two-component regulator propeller domain-containing protein [Sediminibacterium sp.]MDP3568441.1 two-component regulator propeller domain-containing protein [Sediminibacterium sp.]
MPKKLQNQLLFLIILGFISLKISGQNNIHFNRFSVEDGLSSESVLSITQDKKGFLWIGTMDGLNRFDGKRVKVFKSFYNENPIGPSVKITCLLSDSLNRIWIGTNNGLYIYDNRSDSFSFLFHSPNDPFSISNNSINTLYEDRKGNIWVGTAKGLNKAVLRNDTTLFIHIQLNEYPELAFANISCTYDSDNGKILIGSTKGLIELAIDNKKEEYKIEKTIFNKLDVTSVTRDSLTNYWIGTSNNGVFVVNKDFKITQHYQHNIGTQKLLSNVVRKVYTDQLGQIWVGSLKGLDLFSPKAGNHFSFIHHPENKYSLTSNSVYQLMEDRQGNLWVGTFFGGLNYIEANSSPFIIHQQSINKNSISSNIISGIVEDQKNNLWIGTEAEGLNYFDRKKRQFKNIIYDESDKPKLSSNLVKSLIIDDQQNLWVAMHGGGGVNVLDKTGRKLIEFGRNKGKNTISSNAVNALLYDDKQNIWIGTEESGIDIFSRANRKIETFSNFFKGQVLSNESITYLFEDSQKSIWIGTKKGINLLSNIDGKTRIFLKGNNEDQLKSDYINCIAEDKSNQIWVGTYAGLSVFNRETNQFKTYTVKDGLAGNRVVGIVADDENNLWVSTNNGLSFLGPDRSKFYTFNTYDGLPGNVFNYRSFLKDKQGNLLFGTHNGLVEFDPKKISLNLKAPEIIFTGLMINGQPINSFDSSGILSKDISQTNNLILNYNENVISIEYAVINFIKSYKNKSAYLLEGYNKDWIYTNDQKAAFTNVPSGNYNLYIKASNNDGVWTESPLVIQITILPPPWKTWWAYTLYVLVISLISFSIIFFISSRIALKRKLRYEHLVNVKQQELHQMKMDFFTHISHEIRTPLTLIMGPVEMLSGLLSQNGQVQKLLLTIKGNADRLLRLTNQLLDFRKAESGHTHLTISCSNIVAFAKGQFEKFINEADAKKIAYTFNSSKENIPLYFDSHYMEIVLSNLLSNALKFTADGGIVSVDLLESTPEFIEIKISDNGIGIPPEAHSKIFNNYYQADTGSLKHIGSGIGLAFSKALIELHKGKLSFYSSINKDTGSNETCFIINLQKGYNHFDGNFTIVE